MIGSGNVRENPRGIKLTAADWDLRRPIGIKAVAASMPAKKSEESQRLLEQAASALEQMQSRYVALEAELADLKRVHAGSLEEHRLERLRSDEEVARCANAAADFKEIALAQREAIRRGKTERAEKDEQIARLEDAVARLEDAARAAGRASPGVPQEPEFAACADAPADAGFGSLDDDEDVIRFRKHMETVMAA